MKDKAKTSHLPWLIFIGIVGLITFTGYFFVYPQTLYKPGEELFDFGYNLGLIGGVMMLLLLLYPLRKRWGVIGNLGFLPTWFKWHMVLGILGPLFIVFHSTYHVYIPFLHPQGSMNAAIAMYCMLLVSGSGTFGRFFYTKIHHGLYGRQANVKDLQAGIDENGNAKSLFNFAPSIEKALDDFHAVGLEYGKEKGYGFAHFFRVGIKANTLARSLSKELHQIMRTQGEAHHFNVQQQKGMEEMYADYREKLVAYIKAVRDTAQFHTYERLFSWWHIFHIPLVYMMVFSAIYHVYAVHAF